MIYQNMIKIFNNYIIERIKNRNSNEGHYTEQYLYLDKKQHKNSKI